MCGAPLSASDDGLRAFCVKNHSFDRASEGYFNLIVRSGKSASGDPPEAVAARRAFFSDPHGFYAPLEKELEKIILSLDISGSTAALDACCGEGYFTRGMMRCATEKTRKTGACFAFDLSKRAVKYASKSDKNTQYFTSNISDIPLTDSCVGLLTHIFAPVCESEFLRVLSPDGYFVRAFPGKRHLWQMKCELYDTPYENDEDDGVSDAFTLTESRRVKNTVCLDSTALKNLVLMTPYSFRAKKSAVEHLISLDGLDVDTDFIVNIYKKS